MEFNRYKLSKKGIEVPLCTRWNTPNILISGNQRWVPFFAYSENQEIDFTLNTFKKDKNKRKKEFLSKLEKFKNEIRNSRSSTYIVLVSIFPHNWEKLRIYIIKKNYVTTIRGYQNTYYI